MSFDHDLPLALYKANLEFYLKTGKLLQESGQGWLDIGTRAFGDGIAEASAEVDQLIKSGDWQALAALPHDAYWRQLQQRFGDSQAIAQIAISHQTQFFAGLQEALKVWQEESAEILGASGNAFPLEAGFEELLQPWNTLVAAQPKATPSAAKKTPPRTPVKKAARKAPAKASKASAKKAAAKKPAAKKKAPAAKRARS